MTLPNKLTIGRMISIFVIIIISIIPYFRSVTLGSVMTLEDLLILIIFALASFTDYLDGHIARKYNLITTFGKFMDPLADKLLVTSVLLIELERGRFTVFGFSLGFAVMLILTREFMVTGIRLLAASSEQKKIIPANMWGKCKTVSQMMLVIVLLFDGFSFISLTVGNIVKIIFITVATLLTVISGIVYFIDSKDIILESK